MSLSHSHMNERVRTELREVADLLAAAENIADGLVNVLDHAYRHDHRTKGALAAANTAAVLITEERIKAEDRCP